MLGLAIPFEFTSIIYNAEEDGFKLEWNLNQTRPTPSTSLKH